MKPGFTQSTVSASQPRELKACNSIQFISVSGSVTIAFDDGTPITVSTGAYFAAPFPFLFDKVTVQAGAAGSATFVHGVGTLGSGSSAAAGSGSIQASSGDPENVLNASSGQWAYDSSAGALYVNPNASGTTGWVQLI